MTTAIGFLLPVVLLAITGPWCLRMLRSTSAAPAVNRLAQLASMTALACIGAVVLEIGAAPMWTWYPSALAVGLGATALCVRWTVLVEAGPPDRRVRTVVSLVVDAALLVMVAYASLR